ncbi:hypothetical protein B0H10DRAFT_2011329 [Mycena sp. CBHHK59/15]|nr:hypothetical protein B0H10DRAFT_2011329 [Mycena sp. CBHHK59/15]
MLSQPHLPVPLIEKIQSDPMMSDFQTCIFDRNHDKLRSLLRNGTHDLSTIHPDSFIVEDPVAGFTAEMKRDILHLSVYDGDVLAVHEVIGLGFNPDKPDSSGVTPICLAISRLALVTSGSPYLLDCRPDGTPLKAADFEREGSRLAAVASILVEQHVDLNKSMNGEPLVNLVCRSRAWDLLALFLEHGAIPPKDPAPLFRTVSDRAKFATLLKARPTKVSRPPRKCPCWSGKSISDCHETAQPYPLSYLCICGSKKTYQSCCHRRHGRAMEKWDPKLQRLVQDFDNHGRFSDQETAEKIFQKLDAVTRAFGVEPEEFVMSDAKLAHAQKMMAESMPQGLMDPAFAYAFSRAGFNPLPRSRIGSRHVYEKQQKEWNALVDEYIKTSKDQRSRQAIERAAKIGTWNGALIRVCEGPGCEKVEGTDVEILKLCSKCKMAVYCGHDCQKAAWKNHKSKCGKTDQHEQSLPSQDRVADYLGRLKSKMLGAF